MKGLVSPDPPSYVVKITLLSKFSQPADFVFTNNAKEGFAIHSLITLLIRESVAIVSGSSAVSLTHYIGFKKKVNLSWIS